MAKRKTTKDQEISDIEKMFLHIWFSNGFNGTAAYKLIHPNCTDNTARTEAAKLLAKPNIAAEVEMRKFEIQKLSEIKTEEIVQELKTLIAGCKKDGDRNSLIKALDMLNKMSGNYLQRIDHTTNGQNIADINVNIIRPKKTDGD